MPKNTSKLLLHFENEGQTCWSNKKELEVADPDPEAPLYDRLETLLGEAFEAGRLLIDRIKERVPVWKRERGPDGEWWVGWEDARCTPGHHHHHDEHE